MAVIYDTTMTPGKLELLATWLPAQPWYLDRGREPELVAQLAALLRVRGVLATARAETP